MLEGKEKTTVHKRDAQFVHAALFISRPVWGGMQHSWEELVYNGQRECVGGGREREREISRQFYLTESFYQSAQQRQEKDKSLTSEGTGVSPHRQPFRNTHQRTRSHTQANPEDVIDKPQRCREEGALLRDFLWMKEIFGGQLDSRQNVTAANKQSPAVVTAVLLRHLNGCQRRQLSVRQSVCCVVSELLATGGLPMMSRQR